MKKINLFAASTIGLILLSGCSKGYTEGTYSGNATDNYGGETNTATAVIKINGEGKIVDVDLDTTYKGTTKKKLGKDYGMYNHPYGSKVGEWYEQVEKLEKKVIDDQGIDNIKPNGDGKTDAVSGCTIKIDALYKALEEALKQAL